MAGIPEIQPEELTRRLVAGEDIYILDVREPHEYQICNLGGHLIPLGDLPKRVSELESSREIVVHCKTGAAALKQWLSCARRDSAGTQPGGRYPGLV